MFRFLTNYGRHVKVYKFNEIVFSSNYRYSRDRILGIQKKIDKMSIKKDVSMNPWNAGKAHAPLKCKASNRSSGAPIFSHVFGLHG